MLVQTGESVKIKLSRFKRKYEHEWGGHGIVLERVGGGICLYVTDKTHEDIYCVVPLGFEKDFKDVNYYFYPVQEKRMFFRIRRALLYVDLEKKCCATNVENFRVFGCPDWGQDCLIPWESSFTKLYNAAENKRNGKTEEAENER